ncbi:MAG: recombinase family protein [Corynebacterium sp.]|uniref:recombinase family protein n=1 Tax=Corynebacterium sp. TaxID=1720 RepID=UPI003F9C15E2
MPPKDTTTAIYVRISEDHQDGAGVKRQETECRALADRLGLEVTTVYADNDISAYRGKHRPGFTALQDAMAAGEVGAVIAWAPDRISRQVAEAEAFKAGARLAGVRLLYVQGGEMDLTDPNADLFSHLSAAVSQWESAIKGKRIAAAYKQRALSGRPPRAGRRYGYRITDNGDWEIVPHEAKVYREAVENILAGASVRSQVSRINALGEDYWAPARKKRATGEVNRARWAGTTFRRSLMRADTAGIVVYQGEEYPDVQAQWPAIITPDQHRAIVALLSNPDRTTNPGMPGRTPAYLGTGLYRCGGCGETLVSWHDGKDKGGHAVMAYTCRAADTQRHGTSAVKKTHITCRMTNVDAVVEAAVLQRLARADIQQAVAAASVDPAGLQEHLATRSALQVELRELGEAIGRGDLTVAQGAAASRGLNDRLTAVNREIDQRDHSGVLTDLGEAVMDPHRWWESATIVARRSVLEALAVVTVEPVKKRGQFDPSRVAFEWLV